MIRKSYFSRKVFYTLPGKINLATNIPFQDGSFPDSVVSKKVSFPGRPKNMYCCTVEAKSSLIEPTFARTRMTVLYSIGSTVFILHMYSRVD